MGNIYSQAALLILSHCSGAFVFTLLPALSESGSSSRQHKHVGIAKSKNLAQDTACFKQSMPLNAGHFAGGFHQADLELWQPKMHS